MWILLVVLNVSTVLVGDQTYQRWIGLNVSFISVCSESKSELYWRSYACIREAQIDTILYVGAIVVWGYRLVVTYVISNQEVWGSNPGKVAMHHVGDCVFCNMCQHVKQWCQCDVVVSECVWLSECAGVWRRVLAHVGVCCWYLEENLELAVVRLHAVVFY